MIKILMIGMTDNRGGIESFIINYYRKINREEFQIDFVNIYKNGLFFEKEILENNDIIYNLPDYYHHPLKYIKELRKIIKTNKYDVIYCNMNSAVMLFPLIAAKLEKNKNIVCHAHNASSDKGFLKKILHNINRIFIPIFANRYVACSEKAGRWFYTKRVLNSNDYLVINNSIDINQFLYNEQIRSDYRIKLGISNTTYVIGHVGRFNKQKNHSFLIDIYKSYQESNSDSILLLIGDGDLKKDIEEKTKNLGIEDKVKFLGLVSDTNNLYQCMDCFVLPSLYEGLPLVAVEAQCSGLKCLFANTISFESKLLDSVEFLPIGDGVECWKDRLLSDNDIIDRKNAYKNIIEKGYDLNSEVKKFETQIKIWIKSR